MLVRASHSSGTSRLSHTAITIRVGLALLSVYAEFVAGRIHMNLGFGELLILFLIVGGSFLAGRALVLWYWKVNATLETLQRIEKNTARVATILDEVHRSTMAEVEKKAQEFEAALAGASPGI